MKHVDTIHIENNRVTILEIKKQVANRLKQDLNSFQMFRSGTLLEKTHEPASHYNIGHFDSIYIVPKVMSVKPKKRTSTVKRYRPDVDSKTTSWFEDLHWKKRKKLNPILDLLRLAADKEACIKHASNLHLQSALFMFSSRGFHDFDLARKHYKLMEFRLSKSDNVDAVDSITGISRYVFLSPSYSLPLSLYLSSCLLRPSSNTILYPFPALKF